jgi:Raf kinase inhibitor-like YbhB/YbcL family protein
MKIISPAFHNDKPIPVKYAYRGVVGGKNISPPFQWSIIPEHTKSLALTIIDPHPVAKHWVHWVVINIPANIMELHEGASQHVMPEVAVELYNSYGEIGYGGPEPPKGSGVHPYVVTLYALKATMLSISDRPNSHDIHKAMEGKILGSTTLTGTFER